jgi:hypothetical protein
VATDLGGRYGATHHSSSNQEITVTGDRATSHSYLQAIHVIDKADRWTHWDAGGWYDNEYRRTPEGWRLTRVALTNVWQAGAPRP